MSIPHTGGGDPKALAKDLAQSQYSPHGWG